MNNDVYDASADAYGMWVECPRCNRSTEASKIWVWIGGQAEPLRLVSGEIRQSGRGTPDLFDLACGCTFATRAWKLRVRSTVTLRTGGSMSIHVEPRHLYPIELPEE